MIIDNFNPFSEDYSNKNGLTIELDFSLSDIIDYEDDLISCLSTDDQSEKKFMGFRITGNPNTINSLTLNTIGTAANFDNLRLLYFLLNTKMATNRDIVHPQPPIKINTSKNGFVKISVGSSPFATS